MLTADEVVAAFELKSLPGEGGFYRETYRSRATLNQFGLIADVGKSKSLSTAIFYLLTPETQSFMHRLPSDELFHFYLGSPITMLQLFEGGGGMQATLGTNFRAGQQLQMIVPQGTWQGSFLQAGGDFALMGTTMSPGFDFVDLELGDRAALVARYPSFVELIERLTPTPGSYDRI